MRQLVVLLAVMLSGCSLLFDPGKLDAGIAACLSACASRSNADVTCGSAGECGWTCKSGFVDTNGDLVAASSNGCETDCATAAAAENPAGVIATVGISGTVDLKWPNAVADTFHVCTGPNFEVCVDVPAAGNCDPTTCTTQLTALPDNTRVKSRVQSVSQCKGPAEQATAPVVSYTTVNGGTKFGFNIDDCTGTSISDLGGGVMQLTDSQTNCLSVLQTGDDQWGDGTVQVDLLFPIANQAPTAVGVALHTQTSTGYAVAAATTLADADRCSNIYYRTTKLNPTAGAASVFCPQLNQWTTLAMTTTGGVFSVSVTPEGGTTREVMRWTSPVPGAAGKLGRPALYIYQLLGTGQVNLRNFRVSTWSKLPTTGPTSFNANFVNGFPADWHVRSSSGALNAVVVACPVRTDGTGCVVPGGCSPAAGSSCARVQHTAFNGGTASVDLPVGIDTNQPWHASMRFLIDGASFNNARVLDTAFGTLLDTNGMSPQSLRSGGTVLTFPAEVSRWHVADFAFQPDAGTWGVNVDGVGAQVVAVPAGQGTHPGGFQLGGAPAFVSATYDVYVTDFSVAQP